MTLDPCLYRAQSSVVAASSGCPGFDLSHTRGEFDSERVTEPHDVREAGVSHAALDTADLEA
jgi:hypothetical protein